MKNKLVAIFSVMSGLATVFWVYTHTIDVGILGTPFSITSFYYWYPVLLLLSVWDFVMSWKSYKHSEKNTFFWFIVLNATFPLTVFFYLVVPYFI